jgi:hypothetical protein
LTKAESTAYRLGLIIGMTATRRFLVREAERHATMNVTDYDVWHQTKSRSV